MVSVGNFSDSSEFESQISDFEQDTGFDIFWFVNKARVMLLFEYVLHCYKFQLNVSLSF